MTVDAIFNQPATEQRDVRCSHSDNFPLLLEKLKISLLVSTYQTGHLITVSASGGRLAMSFHQFDRAMGLAVKQGAIAVCTRREVWFLREVPGMAAKLGQNGKHDACFFARTSHFTGDMQAHEAAWVNGREGASEFWVVNTLFSCLCALDPFYSFAPRWTPPFISALRPEDRCHLNGVAVANGQPRYITLLAKTDTPSGWRAVKNNGGLLMEVPSGNVVADGLSLPHSPRVDGDLIYFLQSGTGELCFADTKTGIVQRVAVVPGVARGLTLHGGFAFVGISKARPSLEGVSIVAERDKLRCGIWVIALRSGEVVGHLEFCSGVDEVFDVQIPAGVAAPFISDPSSADALWTIPPKRS